jgi:hypothetical protein
MPNLEATTRGAALERSVLTFGAASADVVGHQLSTIAGAAFPLNHEPFGRS